MRLTRWKLSRVGSCCCCGSLGAPHPQPPVPPVLPCAQGGVVCWKVFSASVSTFCLLQALCVPLRWVSLCPRPSSCGRVLGCESVPASPGLGLGWSSVVWVQPQTWPAGSLCLGGSVQALGDSLQVFPVGLHLCPGGDRAITGLAAPSLLALACSVGEKGPARASHPSHSSLHPGKMSPNLSCPAPIFLRSSWEAVERSPGGALNLGCASPSDLYCHCRPTTRGLQRLGKSVG